MPVRVRRLPGGWRIPTKRSREQRLDEFFRRLAQRLPVSSAEDALAVLVSTLNEVEDELSGIPYNPESWAMDGRLYPPLPDSRRPVPGRPDLARWRSKAHNTYIRDNGALAIVRAPDGVIVFEAPGQDGRGVWE